MSQEKLLGEQISLLKKIEMYSAQIEKNTKPNNILTATGSEKIAAAGGDSGGKKVNAKGLNGLSKDIKTTIDAIVSFDDTAFGKSENFIKFINNLTNSPIFAVKNNKFKDAEKNMGVISKSLKEFSGSMISAITTMASSITDQTKALQDSNTIQKGLQNLVMTGDSIWAFTKKMALVSLLAVPARIGVAIFASGLPAIIKIYDVLSKHDKDISKGAKNLGIMGGSLLVFTGAVVLSTVVMGAAMSGETAMAGGVVLLTIGLAALTFGIIGKFGPTISKGALAVLLMGGSMLLFTLAYTKSVELASQTNPLPLIFALGGVGAIFAIAGMVWKQIALGALAFGVAGLAMWIFASPYEKMALAIAKNPNAMWQIPLSLVGIGAAFALAGTGPIPFAIGAGALALGLAGGALWVIGKGVQSFANITQKTADGVEYAIKGVVRGFAGAFEDLSVADVLTLPLKIPMIAGMGLALAGLGYGLNIYKARAGDWSPADADKLAYTVNSVGRAFAIAGTTEGMSELFGFKVGENSVERGIESVRDVGDTLESLSRGILAWKDKITDKEIDLVNSNIQKVLATIPMSFAKIGGIERESMEHFWSDGDVENGIESVESLGTTLESLSKGILAWKDKITDKEIDQISSNITKLLATIPSAFAQIGKTDRDTSGIFPWSEGDVENGIELVNDLSPSISAFASLLTSIKGEDAAVKGQQISSSILSITDGYVKASLLVEKVKPANFSNMVSYLTRLTNLSTPMEKLNKTFTSFNVQFSKHIDMINSLKKENITSLSDYTVALAELSKANTADIESNLAALGKSKDIPLAPIPPQVQIQQVAPPALVNQRPTPTVAPQTAAQQKNQKVVDPNTEILMQILQVMQSMASKSDSQAKELADIKRQLTSGTLNVKNNGLI